MALFSEITQSAVKTIINHIVQVDFLKVDFLKVDFLKVDFLRVFRF